MTDACPMPGRRPKKRRSQGTGITGKHGRPPGVGEVQDGFRVARPAGNHVLLLEVFCPCGTGRGGDWALCILSTGLSQVWRRLLG